MDNNKQQFYYLSNLAELHIQAKLRDGKIILAPKSLITPKVQAVVAANKAAIIEEIKALEAQVQQQNQQKQTQNYTQPKPIFATTPNPRWSDPRHDLDTIYTAHIALFAYCAYIGWPFERYWDGLPNPIPARPYCYIKAELVDNHYYYYPMLAEADGVDYLWTDVEAWAEKHPQEVGDKAVVGDKAAA